MIASAGLSWIDETAGDGAPGPVAGLTGVGGTPGDGAAGPMAGSCGVAGVVPTAGVPGAAADHAAVIAPEPRRRR
jgi:hypothetical protein